MGLESATYISQLVDTNPTASDPVSQGDDHLRLVKSVLQSQFTTLGAAAVTTTAAELNLLDGVTSLGDVAGPGSSTDNAIVRFNGTGGKTIQNSTVTISDDPPVITIGDGTAEDTTIVFDGNAKDFYVALDDTADKLLIGEGSTVGTNPIMTITDDAVTIGDGATVDTYLNFDGNTVDYRVGIDDGTDKLEIGAGTAHGATTAIAIDSAADMTLGGYINFSDEQAIRPEIKDYAESVNAIGGTGGGTQDIDIESGNVVTATVDTSTNTFTFSNPSTTGKGCSFTLILTNGGSQTVNWPGAVDWAGGSAPSLTTSGVDVLVFTTVDAGTIWYGFPAGLAMA
tara:strand:+ start:611 stop:1630 length:1020 start_codon:yes stop_codon:yes gene_type:complete